jgi:hypothetical protein
MKNYYFLNPGEFFVSQQLALKRPELRLYFPLRDQGCDLLAVDEKASRIVKIQVKESRAYPKKGRSWHQLKKGKIEAADIFVFVTYVPGSSEARLKFETQFIVIPKNNLIKMCSDKTASKGKYLIVCLRSERLAKRRWMSANNTTPGSSFSCSRGPNNANGASGWPLSVFLLCWRPRRTTPHSRGKG